MAMENFFRIRAEKQAHIVNAAFMVFGRQGYRKASLSDIAQEAGITKGMITYYFGSKKTLYLYLLSVSRGLLIQATSQMLSPEITDIFEKLKIITEIQISAMKEHPGLVSFVNSLYSEKDPEVTGEIENSITLEYGRLDDLILSGVDSGNQLLYKFIFWASNGFMMELYETDFSKTLVDDLADKFYKCLDLMREAFYRR